MLAIRAALLDGRGGQTRRLRHGYTSDVQVDVFPALIEAYDATQDGKEEAEDDQPAENDGNDEQCFFGPGLMSWYEYSGRRGRRSC